MSVESVTSSSGAITSIAGGGDSATANLGFDTFLKLLVTQLQNQDPLNPMDGTQFTEQMATFSQLEQQMQTNSYLEDISAARDYSAQTLAVSYIGKEALVPVGQEFENAAVSLPEDGTVGFAYTLADTAYDVQIKVFNEEGDLVRQETGDNFEGVNAYVWDGKDSAGEQAEAGIYNVEITAVSKDGDKIAHRLYSYGEVAAVAADGAGSITLSLKDGREANFNDVLQVKDAGASTTL
ncbi:MAG: flagellar hook assembly protein FlgD [Alphaproteobacteria bacterium]|nr:flagellar hook assembly protein FlgD [Alphaproteobacteria bacterium]MDD9919082.1 flagellar hook assembly protein FlgD [Alphaproteobacteria bacterium]